MYPRTTDIHPYRHTLSLHHALPVCSDRSRGGGATQGRDSTPRPPGNPPPDGNGGSGLYSRNFWNLVQAGGSTYLKFDSTLYCADKHRSCSCRSEEHTSELQSLMRISYAVFCLKKKKPTPVKSPHNSNINNIRTEQHARHTQLQI